MVLHNWLCAFMHISFNPHRSPFYKWGWGSNSFGNLLNIMQLLCSRVWNLNHKFFVTKFYFPLLSAASLMIWPCIHSIKQIKDIPGITQHLLQETSFGELLIGEVLHSNIFYHKTPFHPVSKWLDQSGHLPMDSEQLTRNKGNVMAWKDEQGQLDSIF